MCMGRPKNFSREEVLEKAMPVFWKSGFATTSLQARERATGVNKSGLYTEFRDKEDLFVACLRHYLESQEKRGLLTKEPLGWKNVESFLAPSGWPRVPPSCCPCPTFTSCSLCRTSYPRLCFSLLSVLHTWGQNLRHYPHVHCLVPAGGLAMDGTGWVTASPRFFLPVRVLSRVFRGKFTAALKQLSLQGKLQFHGSLQELARPECLRRFLRQLVTKEWVVYAKPPFGGAEHVLN